MIGGKSFYRLTTVPFVLMKRLSITEQDQKSIDAIGGKGAQWLLK